MARDHRLAPLLWPEAHPVGLALLLPGLLAALVRALL